MTSNQPKPPTRGQLERTLSQQFQKLYRQHLDHATGKISCQLSSHQLTVIVEDSLTQPEQLLLDESSPDLVEQVRSDLDDVIRPKIITLVESVLGKAVIDIMSETTLTTGRTGIVIVLEDRAEPKDQRPVADTATVSLG
ncbi:MAG: DUF2294 domain-containing protein [Leptolyngbyaceae cyanobacterium SM2_3_12]|nr:DUF2294 domain-containing protein [Leptolyngbyaceae cyanobacterium SM2_3_12]